MNFVWMLLAFLMLSGMAVGFCGLMKVNMGEGMLLSVSSAIGAMYLSGLAGAFIYGVYAIGILTAAGYLSGIFLKRNGRRALAAGLLSPAFFVLLLLLLYGLIFFYNDFIQHVDEFHQWAAAVKYMWEYDRFPLYGDFIGGRQPFATSLFHLFFQEITGYNEQNMYISALLLMWVGFLLPISEFDRRNWKKVGLYSLLVFFSIYSLYYYGSKNLYVDLPAAAWAGGLAGWWMNRRKKKANGIILGAGIVMIYFFKSFVGLLLSVFVLAFVLMERLLIEKKIQDTRSGRKKLILFFSVAGSLGVLLVAATGIFVAGIDGYVTSMSEAFQARAAMLQITGEKAFETLASLISGILGSALSPSSNLKLTLFVMIIVSFIIFLVSGELYQKKKESRIYVIYGALMTAGYCIVLYFAFIFMFSYEESIETAGSMRYFAVMGLYLYLIALAFLFQRGKLFHRRLQQYLSLGLLLLFLYGLNGNFITETTALRKDRVPGYTAISETRQQLEQVRSIISDTDKVYFLTQDQSNEFATNTALYYLEQQVSNYLATPWKFTEEGSITRLAETEYPSIEDFPTLLAQGGYTYVWVYKTDAYLTEKLPEVIKCKKIKSGRLYRVVYKNGEAVRLKLAADLIVEEDEE